MGERKEKERKEKEEKDAQAKKEKEEIAKKERDERRRKEREEKQKQAVKKEIPSDDVKDNDKSKKKLVAIKSKPKDAALPKTRKPEVKAESNDAAAVKARKAMPSKPLVHKSSTPPPSKLKKDESNKKVMETRKAAAARTQRKQPDNEEKNRLNKVGRPAMRKAKEKNASGEERKMDEKSVVEKVSKAIASGEIDDSRVIKDDEDDRESIVEKDQIEEMETSPINHRDKDFVKVGEDDEEEEDNQDRVPDIAPSEDKKEADESPPKELDLEKAPPKVAYSHVKTPDEVDDLPEHEVVNPDESMLEEIKSEMPYDLKEKIAKLVPRPRRQLMRMKKLSVIRKRG